jgi:outer membrane autotransporter protein
MKWKAPTLNGFINTAAQSPDANTYGARLDMGYRYAFAPSWFIEPTATLSYAKTDIDALAIPGGSVGMDGQSLRGALGVRLGTGFQMSATTQLEASLTGRVWNEFDGDNRAAIVNAGPTFFAIDKFDGAYGEVVGLLNVFNAGSGWSGFANVGVKFNGDFTTTTAKAGLRYVWGAAPRATPAPVVVLSARN